MKFIQPVGKPCPGLTLPQKIAKQKSRDLGSCLGRIGDSACLFTKSPPLHNLSRNEGVGQTPAAPGCLFTVKRYNPGSDKHLRNKWVSIRTVGQKEQDDSYPKCTPALHSNTQQLCSALLLQSAHKHPVLSMALAGNRERGLGVHWDLLIPGIIELSWEKMPSTATGRNETVLS